MKGQTYVILTIIFIIIISVFAVLNVANVEVNYIFWKGSSPLIFVILFSVLLGGVLTMVVGSKRFFTLHRENKALKEQLAKYGSIEETDVVNEDIQALESIEEVPEENRQE